MPYTAFANSVLFENLLEEQAYLEEELYNALLVAVAFTIFDGNINCITASVALSVVVIIGMTERFNFFCFNLIITACAMFAFGCSAFCAGRVFGFNINYNVMTESGQYL